MNPLANLLGRVGNCDLEVNNQRSYGDAVLGTDGFNIKLLEKRVVPLYVFLGSAVPSQNVLGLASLIPNFLWGGWGQGSILQHSLEG